MNRDLQGLLNEAFDEDNRALRITGAYVGMVAHGENTVTVVSTDAESDLFSYTVPGGSLVAGDRLRVWISYDFLNDSGSNRTFLPRLYIGTTAVLTGSAVTLSASATRRSGMGEFVLTCVDGTNQKASGQMLAATGANFPGQTTATISWVGVGAATEDTSSAKALKLTMQLGASHASLDFRLHSYFIEKIPVRSA